MIHDAYRAKIIAGYQSPIFRILEAAAAEATPTAAYYYNADSFGLAFASAVSVFGNPDYTVAGKIVIAASSNPSGVNAVTCQITANSVAVGKDVVVSAGDTNVTAGGLYVAAGNYTLIAPPALTLDIAPEVTGTLEVGETLSCTDGTWVGYGYDRATYTYQWQRSTDGESAWANIASATNNTYVLVEEDDSIKFIRCQVVATVGGTASTAANSNVVGPIVGTITLTHPSSGTLPVYADGIFRMGGVGLGGNGNPGYAGTSTTAAGGSGGGAGGLIEASRECFISENLDYNTYDLSAYAIWTISGQMIFGPAASGTTGATGGYSGSTWKNIETPSAVNGSGGLTGQGGAGGSPTPGSILFLSVGAGGAGGTTVAQGESGGIPGGGGGGGGVGPSGQDIAGNGGASQVKIRFIAPLIEPVHVYGFTDSRDVYFLFSGAVTVSGGGGSYKYNGSNSCGNFTLFGSKTVGIPFVSSIAISGNVTVPFKDSIIRNGLGAYVSSGQYVLEAPPAPTNTVAPAVAGTAATGNVLTTSNGTFTGWGLSLVTYLKKWQSSVDGSSWSDIGGETSSTFTPTYTQTKRYIRSQIAPVLGSTTGSYVSSAGIGPLLPGGLGNVALSSGNVTVPNNDSGDLLIIILRRQGNATAYSAPTDWTLQHDAVDALGTDNVAVYTRVSPGGLTTVNFASGTSSDVYCCINVGPMTFDSATVASSTTPSTSIVAPTVTPSVASTLINIYTIRWAGISTITAPGGQSWIVKGTGLNPSSSISYMVAAFESVASGATGTRTATASTSSSRPVGVSILVH